MRAELAVLHVLEAVLSHLGKEQLVGIHREGRLCGLNKAGAVALFGIAVKGELADHQRGIAQIPGAQVQLALGIRENAQTRAFIGKFWHDVQRVGIPDPQQDHDSRPNGAGLAAFHPHTGGGYGLNNCSHCVNSLSP